MQAIVLAAGFGSRLEKPLNKIPKSLLKIKNKTILYNILNNLILNNIININIVIGYKQKIIKKYVLKEFKKRAKFKFIYNRFYKKRGNIYSVFLTNKFIKDKVIIFNADIIISKNTLRKLIYNSEKNLFLANNKKQINKDDIIFHYNNRKIVKKVYIKPSSKKNSLNLVPSAGVAKMEFDTYRKYINILKSLDFDNEKYYEKGYQQLIKLTKFKVYISNKKIIEVDTKSDYENLLIKYR